MFFQGLSSRGAGYEVGDLQCMLQSQVTWVAMRDDYDFGVLATSGPAINLCGCLQGTARDMSATVVCAAVFIMIILY